MKHNKELKAYQEILMTMFKLNEKNTGVIGIHKVSLVTFMKWFNKYWSKYHAKEFRK